MKRKNYFQFLLLSLSLIFSTELLADHQFDIDDLFFITSSAEHKVWTHDSTEALTDNPTELHDLANTTRLSQDSDTTLLTAAINTLTITGEITDNHLGYKNVSLVQYELSTGSPIEVQQFKCTISDDRIQFTCPNFSNTDGGLLSFAIEEQFSIAPSFYSAQSNIKVGAIDLSIEDSPSNELAAEEGIPSSSIEFQYANSNTVTSPGTPSAFVVKKGTTDNLLHFSWQKSGLNESHFIIERSLENGPYSFFAQVDAAREFFQDKISYYNGLHRYRIYAVNAEGNSEYSDVVIYYPNTQDAPLSDDGALNPLFILTLLSLFFVLAIRRFIN